jgi:hypothetical protein
MATPAHAAQFTLGSFDVTLRDSDPGLVLWETPLLGTPTTFELNTVGSTVSKQLFRIGTGEEALNVDDLVPYDISVAFNFTYPGSFAGTALGMTGAGWLFKDFGYVTWDNPLKVAFGNSGLLGISLTNVTFGLPGSARVDAKFTLLQADTGGATRVPEPATMLLFGMAGAALTFARRRAGYTA